MSAGQNPMPHPDENLLAAFAEQALAAVERESVLLHLSSCARCREIVFLTQESAPLPEAVPEVAIRSARSRWLHWQTAMAGAWVVALVAATALLWHSHWMSPSRDELVILQPAPPPARAQTENNHPAKAIPAPPPPPPTASAISNEAAVEKKSPGVRQNIENGRIENAPAVEPKAAVPAQSFIAPPAGAPQQQNAVATDQLRSMKVQGKQIETTQTNSEEMQAAPRQPEPMAPPTMFEASNTLAESKSMAGTAQRKPAAVAGSPAAQMTAPVLISQFSVIKGKLRRLDAGGYTNVALPARTTAHAVAAYANVVLLLTRHNALYRSADYGEHWIEIPVQWSGKVAELHLTPASAASQPSRDRVNGSGGAIGYSAAATDARSAGALQSAEASATAHSPAPAAKTKALSPSAFAFELTNSAGKRWLSRDGGQSWQPE